MEYRCTSDSQNTITFGIKLLQKLGDKHMLLSGLGDPKYIGLSDLQQELADSLLVDVKYSFIEWVLFRLLEYKLTTVITFTLHVLDEMKNH